MRQTDRVARIGGEEFAVVMPGLEQTEAVIGAAGSAYLGHELESRYQQNEDAHKITVRMEDGAYQTLMQSTDVNFRVGERVLIGNGLVQRY